MGNVSDAAHSHKSALSALKEQKRVLKRQKSERPKTQQQIDAEHAKKIDKEIKNSIADIFAEKWKPEIDAAVSEGKFKVCISLDDGTCHPERRALAKYGKPLLQSKGYGVHVEQRDLTHYEIDGEWIEHSFSLLVSW